MRASPIVSDGSWLSRLDQVFFRLESRLNVISGLVILGLVFLAVVHVLSRKFFNAPVPGYVDLTQQFMAIFVFFGVSFCQREGGHIRMDILVGRLSGRALWTVETISTLLMLLVTTALVFGSWFHFQRSFDWNSTFWSRDSSMDIYLPFWPSKLIVPVALTLLWARLALQLWAYGRALWLNQERPAGVPLPDGPAASRATTSESEDFG